MLLTENEKKDAWRRLTNGISVKGDAMLIHSMIGAEKTTRSLTEIDEIKGNKARAAFRLVQRGIIITSTSFKRVTKQLMRD